MRDVSSRRWGATLQKLASLGLLAVAGLILLGPASASAAAASIDLPTGTSVADVDALEVSSYQDDFEVSKQTAEESLQAQEDGAGIAEQLEDTQGKNYAGVWFDNESGEFVVPTVASASQASIESVLDASDLQGDFRTKPVDSSWDQLQAAQERINSALLALIEEGLVGTGLDPKTNAVVISQAAGASAPQRAQIQALAQSESVKVEVRESQERQLGISPQACQFQAAACDAPMRGGVNIVPNGGLRGGGCTAGFKGIGDALGNRFVLTAGHCIAESGGVLKWDSFTAAPEARKDLGHVDAYSFPTHDYAAINATGTYWDKPSWPSLVTYWGLNQEYPIYNESTSYIGEYVCHAGQQSGLSCGTVTGMHLFEPIEDSSGHILGYVGNLTRFEHICTIGGDSGGPVFAAAGNIALGIYSSSSKTPGALNPCYWNGYYTEITEDTDLLGVHVAPRIAPPPSWHPAESLGGTFTSDLDVASWGPGRLDIFGRGAENALWHKWWNGVTWGPWEYMGGNLASGPSAVSWGNNRIDVVARATDNTILHWWWDGAWHSDNLGGNIASNPDISSWGPGRLDIFGRGPENALWHRAYDGAYFPWENLGGNVAGGPGAVSWAPGRMDIAIRNPSGSIAHWYWLSGWHTDSIPGVIYSDPDLSSWGPGRLDLFAKGPGSELKHLWWQDGVGWSTVWDSLGGPVVEGPGAVSWGLNRIDVVGRGADNSALHWYWGS
jgi:Repeat of unknown function (DUF346)